MGVLFYGNISISHIAKTQNWRINVESMENSESRPSQQELNNKRKRNYPATIRKRKPFKGEIPSGTKFCPECAAVLPIDAFRNHVGSIRPYCIPCTNKLARLRYQRTKSIHREITMKSHYNGFTLEDYNALFEAQGGVCAVCKRAETYISHGNVQPLSVDHCHKTKKVRALLCARCNSAFGLMEENPENIQALLGYAKRWQNT
jgi:hypothetical protein